MPSAFSPLFPLWEESFMKSCYYLVLALLFITILAAPVSAQDMMPVQFIIRDENNQPMTEVTVYIYTTTGAMPPTPGPLYAKITIDSGDYWTLPYGKYLCKPTKVGYVSRFPTEDNRINEGQTVCYLYMDVESGSEPEIGQPVTLRAIDESSKLIPDVTFKIYRCTSSPPYSPIELVRTEYSPSGELYITDLPKDYYCVEVSKSGYSQRYATGENRFSNHDYSSTLNIVMDTEFPPVTLRAIDGTTESLLPGVYFKIYYCDPVTFEQGALVKTTSVTTTGEIVVEGLSRGHYCFEAVKDGYKPRYPATEWRFQTVTDPTSSVACIMDPEDVYQIRFEPFDSDTQTPLNGVTVYVYESASSGTSGVMELGPGEIGLMGSQSDIRAFVGKYVVDYGDVIEIGPGEFLIDAYKPGYIQRFEMTDCRAMNTPEQKTATCLIPMAPYTDPIASLDETEIFHETFAGWPDGWSVGGTEGQYLYEVDNGLQLQTKGGSRATRHVWARYFGDDTPDNMLTETLVVIPNETLVVSETTNVYIGHCTGGIDSPGVYVGFYPQRELARVYVMGTSGIVYSWIQALDTYDHSNPPYTPYKVKIFTSNGRFYTKIVGNHQNEADIPWVLHDYSYNIEEKLSYMARMYSISTEVATIYINGVTMSSVSGHQSSYPITVYVKDDYDLSDLAGATLNVYRMIDGSIGDLVRTVSLPAGYMEITGLEPGIYALEAVYPGYSQIQPITATTVDNRIEPRTITIRMTQEAIEPNQNVEFRPYDTNGHIPLNGVQITVYTCDPVTFEPGSIVDVFTVDYGEIRSLPRGHYCIEASYNDYNQLYTISETRFSNLHGPAVALIPMQYVGSEDGTVEVRIIDVDTEEPLQNVRLRIYEALPNFQQGRLVKEVTVNSGDYIRLTAGQYFAQATKSGYTQYFDVTNTRVAVDPPSPSILYVPMTSRDGISYGEGSFLDQSIEGIANLFGVSFGVGKTILGMLLALGIGTATAKHLRGGAQEFGLGMLGGVVLGVLVGLLPIWVLVLLVLIVGLWIGQRYMSGGDS